MQQLTNWDWITPASKFAIIGIILAVFLSLCCLCALIGAVDDLTGNGPEIARPARSTVTPKPTPTPKPTSTPKPTATPTPASPEEHLLLIIKEVLGPGYRDVPRLTRASLDGDVLNIHWAIDNNLTENMIKTGAKIDIRDMLQAIDEARIEYYLINVEGSFSLVDQLGNSREETVVWATYSVETVSQINWAQFLSRNVYNIASTTKQHPLFWE